MSSYKQESGCALYELNFLLHFLRGTHKSYLESHFRIQEEILKIGEM